LRPDMPVVYTDTPSSSAIARVGYDTITSELRIVFRERPQYPEYIWGGIKPEMATLFLSAPSKGQFYHSQIRGRPAFKLSRFMGSFRLAAVGRRITNKVKGPRF